MISGGGTGKARRVMTGSGKAIIDFQDCEGLYGPSTVWYDGKQIGTVNGRGPVKRNTFEIDFQDGKVLEVQEEASRARAGPSSPERGAGAASW